MPHHEQSCRRHHLLIAGTGRAGTSAIVQYMDGIGLETHLSKHDKTTIFFDETAQAGLEDFPISTITPDLPYVVKCPWSYQFIEEVLADTQIQLDAVVIPIRDLTSAATSRTIVELQAVHRNADWMAQMMTTWEHWAATPGGTIYSLNPIDQARLLAVGLHRLLERLIEADIPILFLAFPKLTTDPDYLFNKLSPVLPDGISIEHAREVHATVFRTSMVRVESELFDNPQGRSIENEFQGPSLSALDNAALKRCLIQQRGQLATLASERDAMRDQLTTLASERDAMRDQLTTPMAHTFLMLMRLMVVIKSIINKAFYRNGK